MVANGFWDLTVAKAGNYRITLRRWPRELDLPMRAEFPMPQWDSSRIDTNSKLNSLPSKALTVTSARLRVGDFDQTSSVDAETKELVFNVELPEGDIDLQTWMTDEAGQSRGAYFVYVEQLKP